jgi:CRP-like cAMP-binding protein
LYVTRPANRTRKVLRRPSASSPHAGGSYSGARRDGLQNRLLLKLPIASRETLLNEASYLELPVGRTFARVGDAIATAYFPDSGLFSLISEMTTGHQLAVAAVGAEGVIGLGVLLGMRQYPHSAVTLVPSRGYLVQADRFLHVFRDSEDLRRIALAYVGGQMDELTIAAACNRIHSHRQRLARWLLVATDKAQQASLPVTHEALAQMVGGPRHAVTVALNQLRTKGAIAYRRGRIDVRKRPALVQEACECYNAPAMASSRGQ